MSTKTYTELIEESTGILWISADLTPTRTRAFIRQYAKLGINLTERGKQWRQDVALSVAIN